MCRLLGVVSSRPVDHRTLLAERPRSLAALGEEHRDGWGLAAASGGRWRIHKGTRPASRDARFRERAMSSSGEILVSHVRKRTVGPTKRANAHPFSRERWVSSMQHIALEGRCFVLSCNQFARRSDYPPTYDSIYGDDPTTVICRGGSCIISPLAEILAGPNYEEETILTATIDRRDIARARLDFDAVGHYARPDVFQLLVDESKKSAVSFR